MTEIHKVCHFGGHSVLQTLTADLEYLLS